MIQQFIQDLIRDMALSWASDHPEALLVGAVLALMMLVGILTTLNTVRRAVLRGVWCLVGCYRRRNDLFDVARRMGGRCRFFAQDYLR